MNKGYNLSMNHAETKTTFALLAMFTIACAPIEAPPDVFVCTTEDVPGIDITLLDENDDEICDGSVILSREDSEREFLTAVETSEGCRYRGGTAAGEYNVLITAPGRVDQEDSLTVNEDECHAITERYQYILEQGRVCPGEPNPGVEVIARNPNNDPVCNAEVIARNDAVEETLVLVQTGPQNCRYVGLFAQPGVYSISVSQAVFAPQVVENVVVAEDECGVLTTPVSVSLALANECPDLFVPAIDLAFVDAEGAPLCELNVTAMHNSGQSIPLEVENCRYRDTLFGRAGEYSLSTPGFSLVPENIVVQEDAAGCDPVTEQVTVTATAL